MQEYIKKLGSGNNTTTLMISNDEMEDMKIVKSLEDSLEDSCLLINGVSKTIQNKAK